MQAKVEVKFQESGFWEVGQKVLRDFIDKNKARNRQTEVKSDRFDKRSTTDIAALLLSNRNNAADRVLIEKAVALDPQSPYLWRALSAYGPLGTDEKTLAKKIFQDSTMDELTRISTAVALAPTDAGAANYAVQKFREIIAVLEGIDESKLLEKLSKTLYSSKPADVQSTQSFLRAMEVRVIQGQILSSLRFLRSPETEILIFECVRAKSNMVSKYGLHLAAEKFPQRLLKDFKPRKTDDPNLIIQYENLYGYMALWHPELKSEIVKKLSAAKLDVVIKRLQRQSFSAFECDGY